MSRAVRRRVPLKAICSRRCESPCSSIRSWREPAPTKTPSEAVSRCAIRSVTTFSPEGRVVISTLMSPLGSTSGMCADKAYGRGLIVWQDRKPFVLRQEPCIAGRQLRGSSRRAGNRRRELRRMRRRQNNERAGKTRSPRFSRRGEPHGRMRVGEIARLAKCLRDLASRFGFFGAEGIEALADDLERPGRDRKPPAALQVRVRKPRRGGARNWTRLECPSMAIGFRRPRAAHSAQPQGYVREYRWSLLQSPVCRREAPCALPHSLQKCRQSCRSARKRRFAATARREQPRS